MCFTCKGCDTRRKNGPIRHTCCYNRMSPQDRQKPHLDHKHHWHFLAPDREGEERRLPVPLKEDCVGQGCSRRFWECIILWAFGSKQGFENA